MGIFISKVVQHSPPSAIVESLQCAKKIASISALKSPGQERGVERRTQTPERHKKSRAMHLLDAPLDKCRGVVFSLTFLLAGILRANARAKVRHNRRASAVLGRAFLLKGAPLSREAVVGGTLVVRASGLVDWGGSRSTQISEWRPVRPLIIICLSETNRRIKA